MAELVRIASGVLSAAIDPVGAELSSLRDVEGRELMTDADPAFWTGRAPLLFPVVGMPSRETIRVDGVAYPMKKHGFARRSRFAVAEVGANQARFVLAESEETRASYPFAFELAVGFRIDGPTLAIEATIANRGDVEMPASFGFHPAFAWPLPYGQDRDAHRIIFAADEPDRLKAIAGDGTIAGATRETPLDGRILHLADALFEKDALVWDDVRSDHVTYGAPAGPRLDIAFPDTSMLGIWTKPGAAYVCVEPWHGIADPESYAGEFRDKPGVFIVPVGGEKLIRMSVTLVP
ncbi:aldose 1-epimerase family protein [Sphingomonas sp.]|uniref:aldose 1-epimerase family protein n=1 Tax=Sphingomonas sp. TaxID=28214 RepID=UPI002D7FEB7F|nr:aldose 1-epimerase family protein [Sphingomonas sp.]HEU0043813.1 aldose 1-epimerase family protein [Sphingomonas sp.]